MNLSIFAKNVTQALKRNSPEIFTALAVSGVVTTTYLTAKASFEAQQIITMDEQAGGTHADKIGRFKERARHTWRLYIPAAVSGTVTIGCIIAASKTSSKRTAAAVTAYSLTERAFSEYREKVVEQIGKSKDQKVRDEIAQDIVTRHPPESKEVIVIGNGNVLCCELYTHRYFRSDMETLRKAQNDINAMVINHRYITLDDFYALLGLPFTDASKDLGWDDERLLELEFSAVISEDNEPCLAFSYNYVKPVP